METVQVQDVSDTALWVATYRAKESERPDALFKDPWAAKLAGERGEKIAKLLGNPAIMTWVMVTRTVAIDRHILRAIELGVDTVLNLGAGLDTRPYRMKLPKDLKWIELDFLHMIDFKNMKLAGDNPVCKLERIAVDLSNTQLRQSVFKRISDTSKKVLVITEGVIPYLDNDSAASLAKDLAAVPNFEYWIQDYREGGVTRNLPRSYKKLLVNSPFLFKVDDWMGFFEKLGWKKFEDISAFEESIRIGRPFPTPFPWNIVVKLMPGILRKKWLSKMKRMSGYVILKKI